MVNLDDSSTATPSVGSCTFIHIPGPIDRRNDFESRPPASPLTSFFMPEADPMSLLSRAPSFIFGHNDLLSMTGAKHERAYCTSTNSANYCQKDLLAATPRSLLSAALLTASGADDCNAKRSMCEFCEQFCSFEYDVQTCESICTSCGVVERRRTAQRLG
eukprot:3519-Pleurochrysis_carterae.AAC.1